MSPQYDPGLWKRSTLSAAKLIGRLQLLGLTAFYHVASAVQWLAEIALIITGGWLVGLRDWINEREEGEES